MTRADSGLRNALGKVEERGSYGEKQIARMLKRHSIRFFYEHPVAVVHREKVRIWYPDFWLPDFGVIVEYAGVVDDDAYTQGVAQKKAVYAASGFPCIYLDPASLKGRWCPNLLYQIRDAVIERQDRWDCLEERLHSTEPHSRESAVYA